MAGKAAPLTVRKQRHQAALAMLAEGCPFSAAVARIAEDWGCSRRQARNVVHRALDEIVADCEAVDHKQLLADTVARIQRIAAKAEKAEQYAAAIGACNSLAGLVLIPRMGGRPPVTRVSGKPPG
jgi:hypothetical protein